MLASCGAVSGAPPEPTAPPPSLSKLRSTAPPTLAASYAPAAPGEVRWSAQSLAHDFTALMFHDEWGRARRSLFRWPGLIRVSIMERDLAPYREHVDALIDGIRERAPNVPIRFTGARPAEIEIRYAPAEAIRQASRGGLCMMTPERGSWRERRARLASGTPQLIAEVETITIFLPRGAAPFLLRACLNEEIMQALGPRNDLSWLEDSIFNDDGVHLAPTAFDYLMLRILYDERLSNGMNEAAARRAAEDVARSLGHGDGGASRASRRADPKFDRMLGRVAVAKNASVLRRAVDAAVGAANRFPAADHRRGAALVAAASAARRADDPQLAFALLGEASAQFLAIVGPDGLRRADAEGRLAALYLRAGDAASALALADAAAPVLDAHRAEASYALTLRIRARALHRLGRGAEANLAARETLAAASFAFGENSDRVARWRREFLRDGRKI